MSIKNSIVLSTVNSYNWSRAVVPNISSSKNSTAKNIHINGSFS